MSEGNYSGQKACSSPILDISRFNLPPLRPCTGMAFQFFSPSNKINPLRAIDQVNFRAWQPLRRAPIFHREKKIRPRAPSSHEISCRPISRANHSTWPIYYPTIVTGLIRRLIRPRPVIMAYSIADFRPVHARFPPSFREHRNNLSNYPRIGKASKRKARNSILRNRLIRADIPLDRCFSIYSIFQNYFVQVNFPAYVVRDLCYLLD